MKSSNQNFEMSILVDDKPIPEYSHDGGTFIEGRSGSEYKIRVRNNSYGRACFVVSVDGLSVLDGKDAADASPGYIVAGHSSLDIACYIVDSATGAKLVFGAKEKSYSAEIGKGTDNVGVIAMRVFAEKPKPYIAPIHYSGCFGGSHHHGSGIRRMASKTYGSAGGAEAASARPAKGWGIGSESTYSTNTSDDGFRGVLSNSAGSMSAQSLNTMSDTEADAAVADMADTKLGTVFGESMKWETHTVTFDRQSYPESSLIIYYDTKKNLERRGVKITREAPPLPNPFPANDGCATPPGWRK